MEIKKILVSQPQPAVLEKAPYYEVAKKNKLTVTYKPFIKIEGVSLKEFRSQRTEILEHTAIIFTSRTTVNNFFRICEEARITVPETMKYFCITEAIALYLQKYIIYRKRKIFFADGHFDHFMEMILKHKDEKFILALAEPHNPQVPETLERLKVNFKSVVFARSVSADLSDVKISDYDLLAFYSPNEIATLVANFKKEDIPMIAVFGDKTAAAAAEAGLPIYAKAPAPGVPSMTKAVELLVAEAKSGKTLEPIIVSENREAEEFIKAQEAKPIKKTRAKRKPAEGIAATTTTRTAAVRKSVSAAK
ncbi:MAG: uroporphyrinogen-III synthase [Tidjanibacter sp.]|nr:uroporphyrinogen-III synthase [Tidjanibacter sp.]